MFEAFDQALEELEKMRVQADANLATRGVIRETIRMAAGESGYDVTCMAAVFRQAHEEAVDAFVRQTAIATRLTTVPGGSREWLQLMEEHFASATAQTGTLRVAYKSFFFFVRMLQDAHYKLLFELITTQHSGGMSSMKQALRDANPVGVRLREDIPGYLEWFGWWRDLRNALKDGVSFSFLGPAENLGVNFQVPALADPELAWPQHGVRLSHIVQSLKWCTCACQMIDQISAQTG